MWRSSLTLTLCVWLVPLACGVSHDAASHVESRAGAAGAPENDGAAGGVATSLGGRPGADSSGSAGTLALPVGASGGLFGQGAGEAFSGGGAVSSAGSATDGISLLVFSRTAAYRHDSIPAGLEALKKLSLERGWTFTATEDASRFSDEGLAAQDVVIFLSTTGDVLDDEQQAAFERFIRAGKGFIGIHSATDTEYDWAWYGGLIGAYFREHPSIQEAAVIVEDATNPATATLPNPWRRTDEWYSFQSNPRPKVNVLLSLDERSYSPGSSTMNGDHPIAWCHEYDGGRAFYTALGHTSESYSDPSFIAQLAGAVIWAHSR